MAKTGPKRLLALDANVLFDSAEGKLFAQEFIGFFKEQGFALYVPPTVLAELAFFAESADLHRRTLARNVLLRIQPWGLIPYQLSGLETTIAQRFSARLRERNLLPDDEKHDGEILAETSLAEIPVLITRDGALLAVDETKLAVAFQEADLAPVKIAHPKPFLKAAQQMLSS